jgi:signal transduction histidine kinase
MAGELKRFSAEPDLLPPAAWTPVAGDVVAREMDLMANTIARMRELRRCVTLSLQSLPDATMVVDPDGRVGMANREADALFRMLTGVGPEGQRLDTLMSAFQAPADSEASDELEAHGVAYQIRRTPLGSGVEAPMGWIVRLADISALKAASRQREQVLQLLTHDMRSPQVSILALLNQGEERAPPALAARIAGYARRTLALADDFVNLARAEGAPLDLELLNLPDLMLDAVDDLWPQAQAKGVALLAEPGEAEILARVDRSLITRALINLVGNAVKYTDPGGRVVCRVQVQGKAAVCEIADTGRGMGPDELARLFRRFDRTGPGGKGKADGVGLGLAFVEAVVRRHGGSIAVDSRPGEGSTFRLSLTRAET